MTARKFSETEAPSILVDESRYTEALLSADEDSADLTKSFTEFTKTAKTTIEGQADCWHGEIIAQAMVDRQNYFIDQETTLFERALRRAIEDAGESSAIKSLRYKSYFKEELGRLRARGLETQVATMKGWPALLRAEPEPQVKEWADKLDSRFVKAEAALQARREAQARTRTHRLQELLPLYAKADALRQETHGELSKRASQKNLGRDWPDSFFRTQEKKEPTLLGELRRSLVALAEKRALVLSAEHQKRLDQADERETLVQWVIKAATATNSDDIFSA
jgi:hypothetical protein